MEKVKDVLDDILGGIKERFNNPLVFSFICSWLIVNWKITVALIWYDTTQMQGKTIFEFISCNIYSYKDCYFYLPFILAIAYTFGMPFLKNRVSTFYAAKDKERHDEILKISETATISVNEYLKLKEEYDEKNKILSNLINAKTESDKINILSNELNKKEIELSETRKELEIKESFITSLTDIKIIEGTWKCEYGITNGQTGDEIITIQDNKYTINKNSIYKFRIENFNYNPNTKEVFFIKKLKNKENQYDDTPNILVNSLKFENENLLKGFENDKIYIQYSRYNDNF